MQSDRNEIEPLFLVKLRLPTSLVREMDRLIAGPDSPYLDRNEFVREAVRGRIEEDLAAGVQPYAPAPLRAYDEAIPVAPRGVPERFFSGEWRAAQGLPTAPLQVSGQESFGLHNRDLPTLWSFDRLVALAARHGGPVGWRDYLNDVREHVWTAADVLRAQDEKRGAGMKGAVGFPKPNKGAASEERFVSTHIGTRGAQPEGPFFGLGLAGLVDAGKAIAPTEPGLDVVGRLLDDGVDGTVPHPPRAAARWWTHLRRVAPAEHGAWSKVLRAVAASPTRAELVERFPEWPGSRAETNCMGFISRSREWGLVEPDMTDGRYRLTDLGGAVLSEVGVATR